MQVSGPAKSEVLRFGVFELDLRAGELRKQGVKIKLQDQPFQVLRILLESPGEVVTREDLQHQIWPSDTFVDFEQGLNNSVKRLREALGDSAETPRFVETLPRRGYRFIAPVSGLPKTAPPTSRRFRLALVWVGSFGAFFAIASVYRLTTRRNAQPHPSLAIVRITNNGTVADATMSRDGKYLAYLSDDSDMITRSLRLLQIDTATDTLLVKPVSLDTSLTFSPDSSYVYYVQTEPGKPRALYRVPLLGGAPRKLIEGVAGYAGISPDGKRLAILRHDPASGRKVLVTAAPDGSEESRLVEARQEDEEFFGGPAWSPDGKVLAVWQKTRLVSIPVGGGPLGVIASNLAHVGSAPAWLPDGSGLIVAAGQLNAPEHLLTLWQISYPDGRATRILHQSDQYDRPSLSADSHLLAALQMDQRSSLWLAPADNPDSARPLTPTGGHRIGLSGVAWTPDGRILYSSHAGRFEYWMINPGGTGARQLPLDQELKFYPSVCRDGHTAVFSANGSRNQRVIKRLDLEDGKSQLLVEGFYSQCSPDGAWVFVGSDNGLRKVPIGGGNPILLTDHPCRTFDVSPNGKQIACLYRAGTGQSPKVALFAISGGRSTASLNLPATAGNDLIRWTPDGKAITFEDWRGDTGNLWAQEVAGGPPRQLTHITLDAIPLFAWSPDGRYLLFTRTSGTSDAVMITNYR